MCYSQSHHYYPISLLPNYVSDDKKIYCVLHPLLLPCDYGSEDVVLKERHHYKKTVFPQH